jgi:peptidoglycan/xylan/chitin deacetylase (PgdA/CDA1 family)
MRIPGVKTVKKFSRWLRARMLGGALILGYHRISSTPRDAYQVCVSPENFGEHLHALRKYTRPISLFELVNHLKHGSLPKKSVAITFDDGYADNLYNAKPLLEKFEIPATVFVCTGYTGREFWWDELEWLVTSTRSDPHALRLNAGAIPFKWDQPATSTEENPEIHRQFRRTLYELLLSLDVEDQNHAMDQIRTWAGVSSDEISMPRAMKQDELLQLVDGGLVELGAHTRHHPMLPQLSFERQKEEIDSSKKDLDALLGKQIQGFAYPNGRATADAKRIVREAGFAYACTSLHDVVGPGSDMYELTRFWQQDVDAERFVQGLKLWVNMRMN